MRLRHCSMAAFLGLLLAVGGVHAQQKFPTKPIRLIVPAPSGSGLDVLARTLALKLTDSFKQSVVVDNRPDSGGTIATEILVSANPDGYPCSWYRLPTARPRHSKSFRMTR